MPYNVNDPQIWVKKREAEVAAARERGALFVPTRKPPDPNKYYYRPPQKPKKPQVALPPKVKKEIETEKLPSGAVGRDAYGRPYFGGQSYIQEWWLGAKSRFYAPVEAENKNLIAEDIDRIQSETWRARGGFQVPFAKELEEQDWPALKQALQTEVDLLGKKIEYLGAAFQNIGGETETRNPTTLTYLGRLLKEGLGGLFAVFQESTYETKKWIGAGEELGLAGADPELESPIPYNPFIQDPDSIANRGAIPPGMYGPTRFVYNAVRYLASPTSWEEKKKVISDGYQAGRVLYSGMIDPLIKEEYVRDLQKPDANPWLLGIEHENPLHEAVGEIIVDPWNFVGMGMSKVRDILRIGAGKRTWYQIPASIDNIMQASGKMDDLAIAEHLTDITQTYRIERARAITKLDDLARSTSFVQLTADGKRFVLAREVGELVGYIVGNSKGDPDAILEVLNALVKAGNLDNVDDVATAMTTLLRFDPTPRPFFSKAGMRASHVLRNVLIDEEGIVNAEKFLAGMRRAIAKGDIPELIKYFDKKFVGTLDEMFPTILEMKDVSVAHKAIAQFHDWMYVKGPYKYFNRFFASIYLGMNPGYAFRNMWTNSAQMIIDEGPTVFFRKPTAAFMEAVRWNGGIEPRGMEGFGGIVAGEKGARPRGKITGAMTNAADLFEENAARQVFGKVFPETMHKLLHLDKNLALPDVHRIIDAGLPPELGRYLKAFILEEAGDVTRGTERFIEMYASGVFKKFRSLGILRMDDINVLSDFQLTQKFLRALTLDDVEDVVRAWETAVNDAIRIGDGVIDDLPHIADDAPAAESIMQMSIARQRGGHLSDDMIALASDGAQANHEANIAWEKAIRQSNDQALYYLNAAGNDPAATTEAIRDIMRRVRIRYGDEAYTGEAIVDGTLGIEAKRAAMRFTNETWANHKSIDLATTRDELAEIWVRAGLGDEAPSVINKKEMKDALWQNYWTKQKEFWQNYRDLYAEHARRIIEDIAGFSGIEPDTRMAERLLDRARRYDDFLLDSEIWYDLQRAIKKTDWAAAARIYAHQFGIPSIMADEARRVPGAYLDENLLLNIVNSRSGGRYTELADVPPHVSRQAMLEHAIGEATREVLDTVTDDRLVTAVRELGDKWKQGGLRALDARDRNIIQNMLFSSNPEEAAEIRRLFDEITDLETHISRSAGEADIMNLRRAETAHSELIDDFTQALESIGRRIDAESVPLRMRLGITNVEGLTQPIDELIAKAKELEQAGDIAGAQESYKTAVQYGIQYMQDVFGDYIDNIEYSIGRFWGDVEPTIYITTTEISNAELPDFMYTLQRLARTKFKQNAVIAYGPPLPRQTTFGNVIRENGMLSRVEPALEVDFTRALSEDDMKMLDELMSEFGIGGGTMKPGNTGIEIVHNSWYNVIYGEQIGDAAAWKAASSGFVGELERRGLVQGFNLGPRECWSIGAGQEGDSVRAIARGLGFTGDDWPERLAEHYGSRLYRSYDDYYDSLRGGDTALQAQQRLDEAVYRPAEWSRELARDIAARLPTEKPKLTPDMKPWAGGIPSEARVMYEQRDGLRIFRDRITAGIRQNWGDVVEVKPKRSVIKAIKDWAKEAEPRVAISRLVSGEVARAARDFILHAYPKRRNFDLLLSYIYPFHFWYNRTYFNWAKRIVLEPEVLTAYAIYKNTLSKIHADMPEWWRYNVNTNDLFGINAKNPLFFNLEATLVPFYGLTGVDFNDPRKRVNWWTSVLDDLGKHGPSVWTPFQVATALALYQQGEKEAAARWGTRLIPQTGVLKSVSALLGVPGGWEIDPNILLFHNGLDLFERRRIGRSAGQMIEEGLASQSEAEDAMFNMEGDVWDESRTRAALGRAPGSLTSFFFGAGFRIRPITDQQIDVMDDYLHRFYSMEENLSPDEVADTFAWFRQEFPFFDTVILSRKREEERDRVYAYSVLGRVPPGQKTDMFDALSVDPKLVDKFYEEKGRIWEWPQGDQEKFMAAIVELGALLEMPDTATQVEWRDASRARGDLEDEIIELFGEDIDEKMDVYFNKRRTSTDLANDYLDANPDLADAMDFRTNNIQENWLLNKYYGSIENTRSYMRGKMFDNIEYQLGEDIWDKWDAYFDAKLLGDDVARDFWKENPELEEYIRLRDEWEGIIAEQLADIEVWLPEKPYPVMRHGIPEELSVGQERVLEELEDAGMPEAYGFSWADWQEFMSPELSNLIVDSAVGGEALSENAVESIERLAGNLGIDTELMVELLEESALQQYEPVRLSIKESQLEQMEEVTYLLGEDEALTDKAKEIIKRHAMEIPPMSTKFGRDALHVQGYAMSLPESIARREETGFRRFAYAHGGQYDKSAQIHRHEFGHIIDFNEEISRKPEFQKAVWNWYNRSVEAYEKTGDPEKSDNRPIEAVDYARGVGKNVHLFWMEVYAHLFHKLAWAHSNVPGDVKQYYDPYLTMKVEEGS